MANEAALDIVVGVRDEASAGLQRVSRNTQNVGAALNRSAMALGRFGQAMTNILVLANLLPGSLGQTVNKTLLLATATINAVYAVSQLIKVYQTLNRTWQVSIVLQSVLHALTGFGIVKVAAGLAVGAAAVAGTVALVKRAEGGGFAAGGVVPGPTGKAIPIIAHGGETIVPVGAKPVGGTRPAQAIPIVAHGGETIVPVGAKSVGRTRPAQRTRTESTPAKEAAQARALAQTSRAATERNTAALSGIVGLMRRMAGGGPPAGGTTLGGTTVQPGQRESGRAVAALGGTTVQPGQRESGRAVAALGGTTVQPGQRESGRAVAALGGAVVQGSRAQAGGNGGGPTVVLVNNGVLMGNEADARRLTEEIQRRLRENVRLGR